MTLQEVATKLNKSPHTIRKHIKDGKLRGQLINNKYEISEEALIQYSRDNGAGEMPNFDSTDINKLSSGVDILTSINKLTSQIDKLQDELIEERKRVDEERKRADEAKERSDTLIAQLVAQSTQQARLLEYHQMPFWRRWFRKRWN